MLRFMKISEIDLLIKRDFIIRASFLSKRSRPYIFIC